MVGLRKSHNLYLLLLMKTMFKTFAHGEYSHSEEFQAEARELKQSIGAARKILDLRSRDAFVDFVEGPRLLAMQFDLVRAFPVPDSKLDRFTADVATMLANARRAAEDAFTSTAERVCRTSRRAFALRDWQALKSDLRHNLMDIAPQVVQLQMAAQDTRVAPSTFRPGV